MKTLKIEIEEDVLFDLKIPKDRWSEELKKELAIQLCREKLISIGNARRLAGMEKIDFHFLLGERKVPRHYDLGDYRTDLEPVEKWEADE